MLFMMPTNDDRNHSICSVCGNKLKNEHPYFEHLEIHCGGVAWECSQCHNSDVTFETRSKLEAHENSYRNLVKPFKCCECDLVFDRASQLDYHTRSFHLNEKSQLCQICGKGFFRKADLKTHLNVHLGTNQSICEICGRKFNHVSNLIRHCRTHAGLKPYPCSICGKRFTQISSLARHKNIHDRSLENMTNLVARDVGGKNDCDKKKVIKRRHYCRICGESFQFVVLLRQHEKIHVKKQKSIECITCHGIFQTLDALQRHCCSSISINQQCDTVRKADQDATNVLVNGNVRNIEEKKKENTSEAIIHVEDEQSNIIDELQSHEILNSSSRESRRMNVIGIDNDRDESINISDILSPYNCDDIEFANSEPIQRGNGNGTSQKLIQTAMASTKESPTKCLQIEPNQFFIEVCELDYLRSLGLQTLELQDTGNIAYLQDSFNVPDIDNIDTIENTIDNFNTESIKKIQGLDNNASTLRLIEANSSKQLYELEVNSSTSKSFVQSENNINPSGESVEFCFVDENIYEQWSPQSSHIRKDVIDFNNQSTREEESPTALADSEEHQLKNAQLSSTEHFQNGILQEKSESFKDYGEEANQNSDITETPMVRLVQNEEGEQFFELIRDPVDFDDNEKMKNVADQDFSNRSSHGARHLGKGVPEKKHRAQRLIREKSQRLKEWRQKFECNVCKKHFSTASNLKQHVGIHFSDQQKFLCKQCGISFAWKSTLNKHIASNHRPDGPQKFVCEICPKVYSTLSQVNEHVKRDHLKERNHVCSECGKCFFKKFDLKSHIRIHTNERPYICQVCGKSFHHQSHIIRHERIHSGERLFSCDYCPKTFTQPGSLKVHKQRHCKMSKVDILDYRIDEDDPIALKLL